MTNKVYPTGFRHMHMLIAVLFIGMLTWGLLLDTIGLTAWHKRVGIITLVMVIIFLCQRLGQKHIPYPASMPQWQQVIAAIVIKLIWILMLTMPLSGLLMTMLSGKYATFFSVPVMIPGMAINFDDAHIFGTIHQYVAYTLIGLIVLHILAALRHKCICHDDVCARMFPPK